MERLAFCALIKYRFKIDLQKDKISCANETLAFKYKPLPLNTAKKSRQKDNSSGLKINQVPARVFQFFQRKGDNGPLQKNCYKRCLLHPYHLKLGTAHLRTLSKTLTLVL